MANLHHTRIFLAAFLLTITFLNVQESAGANRRSHCLETLPTSLSQVILERFPGWHTRSRKTSKHGCPGIAKVDFYGDGRSVYAIVIERPSENAGTVDGKLVLVEKKGSEWKLSILNEGNTAGDVWHAPVGEYTDTYGKWTVRSKGDCILYFWYESSEVLYAWTGEKIEEVQMSD